MTDSIVMMGRDWATGQGRVMEVGMVKGQYKVINDVFTPYGLWRTTLDPNGWGEEDYFVQHPEGGLLWVSLTGGLLRVKRFYFDKVGEWVFEDVGETPIPGYDDFQVTRNYLYFYTLNDNSNATGNGYQVRPLSNLMKVAFEGAHPMLELPGLFTTADNRPSWVVQDTLYFEVRPAGQPSGYRWFHGLKIDPTTAERTNFRLAGEATYGGISNIGPTNNRKANVNTMHESNWACFDDGFDGFNFAGPWEFRKWAVDDSGTLVVVNSPQLPSPDFDRKPNRAPVSIPAPLYWLGIDDTPDGSRVNFRATGLTGVNAPTYGAFTSYEWAGHVNMPPPGSGGVHTVNMVVTYGPGLLQRFTAPYDDPTQMWSYGFDSGTIKTTLRRGDNIVNFVDSYDLAYSQGSFFQTDTPGQWRQPFFAAVWDDDNFPVWIGYDPIQKLEGELRSTRRHYRRNS